MAVLLVSQLLGMWVKDRPLADLWRCSVSFSFCGTILVMGLSSMKAVSKHVLGGRKVLMMAVADMSGERTEPVPLPLPGYIRWSDSINHSSIKLKITQNNKILPSNDIDCPQVELLLFPVFPLLVDRGGRTSNVCLILAIRSWLDIKRISSEDGSSIV